MPLDQEALNSLRIDREPIVPQRPRVPRWGWGVLAGLIAILIGLWIYAHRGALEVETASAVQSGGGSASAGVLDASGYVVARRQATVSAKVTGKVAEVLIEEGMAVKEGQLLARLDDTTARPQLELAQRQAEAARKNLDQTEVRLAEAQRALGRAQKLRTDKLISEADVDTAQSQAAALQAQLDALKSQVAVSQASVRVQQQAINDLFVRAPFGGVVISKDAQPGEMVSPISAGGGFTRTGIATLVDMDSREIEVDVNEAFINRVHDKQKAEAALDAYPDWNIPCHVISIVPAADRQKATVKVRIGFDQLDPRILPDMGVKVRFLDESQTPNVRTRPAVEIPASAVFKEDDKNFVWRVRGSVLERVAVSTGGARGDRVEILSGIEAGDTVVTQPSDKMHIGIRVKVKGS